MLDSKSLELAKQIVNPNQRKIDNNMLKLAINNRVLYYLSTTKKLSDIVLEGDKWIDRLRETIKLTDKVLGVKIKYLITRTYKYIPYVTFDIDLFINSEDFNKTIALFKEDGCQISSHDGSLGGRIPGKQKNIKKDNLLTIDLHRDFTWQKRRFLDIELLFSETRKRDISGVKCTIPSAEVEFLLCMSDITHERFNITLLDIIWIEGLSKEIKDWNLIFNQVSKYGWRIVFNETSKIINAMTKEIYDKIVIPDVGVSNINTSLPMFLPIHICWMSYIENLMKNKQFPLTSFAYMHYTRFRYFLSNKNKMPYYDDWVKV